MQKQRTSNLITAFRKALKGAATFLQAQMTSWWR
jgi:hypothetical protein